MLAPELKARYLAFIGVYWHCYGLCAPRSVSLSCSAVYVNLAVRPLLCDWWFAAALSWLLPVHLLPLSGCWLVRPVSLQLHLGPPSDFCPEPDWCGTHRSPRSSPCSKSKQDCQSQAADAARDAPSCRLCLQLESYFDSWCLFSCCWLCLEAAVFVLQQLWSRQDTSLFSYLEYLLCHQYFLLSVRHTRFMGVAVHLYLCYANSCIEQTMRLYFLVHLVSSHLAFFQSFLILWMCH